MPGDTAACHGCLCSESKAVGTARQVILPDTSVTTINTALHGSDHRVAGCVSFQQVPPAVSNLRGTCFVFTGPLARSSTRMLYSNKQSWQRHVGASVQGLVRGVGDLFQCSAMMRAREAPGLGEIHRVEGEGKAATHIQLS